MKTIRTRAIIAFVGMLACWLFPSALWASVQVDGIYYELNTSAKTAAVASNPNYYSGGVNIPESFVYNGNTYNVTSIGSTAFLDCSGMTEVIMPSSVTSIAASAFERCTGLTFLYIGKGVSTINYEAFKNCSNLTSLILPASVKTIGNETFSGCTSLAEIIVERTTVPTISSSTFNGVDKTSCTVYVPEGYRSSYANASNWKTFSNIVDRTVVVTGSCGENGDNVSYTIYSDMTMVVSGSGAIKEGLENGYVVSICKDYRRKIKRVIICEGVTTIGRFSFGDSNNLGFVTIPNSVTSIGSMAFYNCTRLTSVSIPNSVTSIGSGAFCSCTGLSSVSIPNSITSIESETFRECRGLASVAIPNSVTSIDNWAFSDCLGLTSVNIPNSVERIGYGAFQKCTELTSVSIPRSVTFIVENPFIGCEKLGTIRVDSNNNYYDSRNSCNAIIETRSNRLISGCKNSMIPNTVTSIGYVAFSGCIGLYSITIPSSVTSIAGNPFNGCEKLFSIEVDSNNKYYDSRNSCKAIIHTNSNMLISGCKSTTIPNSVTGIGDEAFSGCIGLTSIKIPADVSSIGREAFYGCTNLTSIFLPNSITSIGEHAFENCASLTSITIPSGVTCIEYNTFYGCSGLTSITIPSSVVYIESQAFRECSSLTSIMIPNSVTSIGGFAFALCTGLTTVNIPNSVNSIEDYAFAYCYNLASVKMEKYIPLEIKSSTFRNVNMSACILYVPIGSKSDYENTDYWKDFGKIVEVEYDTDISTLTNAVYVDQVEGLVGGTMDIPVNMKNNFDVRGFQFTMELPEGAIINSWKVNPDRLPSGISANKVLPMERIDGNQIVATCVLNDGNKTFTGNEGVIATVNVTFGSDMEAGTYPIYLTEASISDASALYQIELSDIKATLVLDDYVVGDTNGDGKVLIGDVISILNYIVGERPEGFNEKAADVNSDGKILVGDVIAVLNIIVGL